MRTHGWAGDPPASDEEAVERIVDAAAACIDEVGARVDMAMVASSVGITRQTLYRYFAGRDALIAAATTRAGVPFVERLLRHLDEVRSEEPLVDAVLFCLDELPADRQLSVLFAPGSFNPSVVGEQSLAFTLAVLAELPGHGGVPAERRDLVVELVVRVLQSLLADPATATRDRGELRRLVEVALAGSRGC
ncbi:TetR/AcrR family transcriptional regulator [Dermatobacter hominis]|uniref:TetR/AcrR family transcriptional regulator n=1 Tax=Dermatobacter hominis TaxID=2884263 RepID=UPI001D1199EC|nr:helix-turn-helix domain-containing protein [Dermatobacter hominis]UDY35244.1 TetR/AcrR family transcriptional regulator [Dermatobacter hominis]